MKVRARFLKTDLILLRSPVMLRKLDCSRNKTLYNSISNEKLVMQTLDLLELTLAKLHLWSAVSSRQPYLKKKKNANISAPNIRRRKQNIKRTGFLNI